MVRQEVFKNHLLIPLKLPMKTFIQLQSQLESCATGSFLETVRMTSNNEHLMTKYNNVDLKRIRWGKFIIKHTLTPDSSEASEGSQT